VSREEIKRGDLLYYPLDLQSSPIVGVKLYPEDRQAHFIKHGREIIFLHGTSEIEGRLIMPAEAVCADDGAVIATLRLSSPVITKTGDHFVLRLPTPSLLVGGGIVIDPMLPAFRRSSAEHWRFLQEASTLTPEDLAVYQLRTKMILVEKDILAQSLFTPGKISEAVEALVDSKVALRRDKYIILKSLWDESAARIVKLVDEFHKTHQHLEAMPLADLESQASCPEALFELLVESLISQGKLARFEAGIKLAGYSAGLSGDLARLRDEIVATLSDKSCPALARKELLSRHNNAGEVFAYLKQRRQIVEFGGLVLLSKNFSQLVDQIVSFIKKKGKITVAEARDVTRTTRKVAVPLLEEMDRRGITVRKGDFRDLAP
jgi:selenocysteine-specific elongation factor